MTKREVMELFETQTELAEVLGISLQAVSQWHPDRDIPNEQFLKLRYELMPDSFKKDGTLRTSRA